MNPEETLDEAEALAALLVEESAIVPEVVPVATTVTLPAGFTITPELLAQGQALATQFLGGTAANTNALQALVERLAPSSVPLTPEQNNARLEKLTKEFFDDPEALIKKLSTTAAPATQVNSALDPLIEKDGARTIKDFLADQKEVINHPGLYAKVKTHFDKIIGQRDANGRSSAYHVGNMGSTEANEALQAVFDRALGRHTLESKALAAINAKVAQTTGSGSGLGTSQSSGIQKFAETAAKAAATQADGKVDQAKYKEYLSAALEGLE